MNKLKPVFDTFKLKQQIAQIEFDEINKSQMGLDSIINPKNISYGKPLSFNEVVKRLNKGK